MNTSTVTTEQEKQYRRACDILKEISDSHYLELSRVMNGAFVESYDFDQPAYERGRWFGMDQGELIKAVELEGGRDIGMLDNDDLKLACQVLYFG